MWQEKRSSPRHVIELPIQYQQVEGRDGGFLKIMPLKGLQSQTKDFSESGLLFLTHECFKKGAFLELTFCLRDKVFKAKGCVVRSESDQESKMYRTAVSFLAPDSLFKVKIAEQIYLIEQYRQSLSEKEERLVTKQEAAEKWIRKNSAEFSKFYPR